MPLLTCTRFGAAATDANLAPAAGGHRPGRTAVGPSLVVTMVACGGAFPGSGADDK